MFFTHWSLLDIDTVPMELDPNRIYYIQAQAWALKGYLGGTHSWLSFYSYKHKSWLVVELTDINTLMVQDANIVYVGDVHDIYQHSPFITKRPYNSRWFGKDPIVVDSCMAIVDYDQILNAAKEYPFKEFKLLYRNCNTFTSYMIAKLNLPLRRPFRSFGFRNRRWWKKHGT